MNTPNNNSNRRNNDNRSPFNRTPYMPFCNKNNKNGPILRPPAPILEPPAAPIAQQASASAPQGMAAPKPYFLSSMKLKNGRRPMRSPNRSYTVAPRQFKDADGQMQQPKATIIPPLAPGNIRIIPLGGVEEIGMNMTMVEMGNDIIVIDAGFKFKQEDTPGIDYIIPNTKYLEERKDKVRGIIITHGHLDHVGGIPYIMERIGNPPMYTRNLTALIIKKRQAEFPHASPINYKIVESTDKLMIGDITVEFFNVTHSNCTRVTRRSLGIKNYTQIDK